MMDNPPNSQGLRIKCSECGEILDLEQKYCANCGQANRVSVTVTDSMPLLVVPVAPTENLPAPTYSRRISGAILNSSNEIRAIVTKLPLVRPEAWPAVSEALIECERVLRSRAKKADRFSKAASDIFGVVAAILGGATVALAEQPSSYPLVFLVGASFIVCFLSKIVAHISSSQHDEFNDDAEALENARLRHAHT